MHTHTHNMAAVTTPNVHDVYNQMCMDQKKKAHQYQAQAAHHTQMHTTYICKILLIYSKSMDTHIRIYPSTPSLHSIPPLHPSTPSLYSKSVGSHIGVSCDGDGVENSAGGVKSENASSPNDAPSGLPFGC